MSTCAGTRKEPRFPPLLEASPWGSCAWKTQKKRYLGVFKDDQTTKQGLG